jgi:hypothetical protein
MPGIAGHLLSAYNGHYATAAQSGLCFMMFMFHPCSLSSSAMLGDVSFARIAGLHVASLDGLDTGSSLDAAIEFGVNGGPGLGAIMDVSFNLVEALSLALGSVRGLAAGHVLGNRWRGEQAGEDGGGELFRVGHAIRSFV